jgi:hypothetical protein
MCEKSHPKTQLIYADKKNTGHIVTSIFNFYKQINRSEDQKFGTSSTTC